MTADIHALKQPVTGDDWAKGSPDAPVTVLEYADFQCPVCQAAYPAIERMLESLGDQVRFVLRHFPVTSRHPQAEHAALAAEAAGRQGRFWEMYRRLFEAGGELSDRDLLRYAEELGLDVEQFTAGMSDPALLGKIRRQKMLGLRSGVNGTPTLYLDGVRYDGPSPSAGETALREAIEGLLQQREVSARTE